MTFQLQNDSAKSTSTQIGQFYAREILTGRLAPGTKLPSNAELATLWKTSERAIHAALGGLVVQGLIERKQRRGTFVRELFQNAIVGVLVGGSLIRDTTTFIRVLCAELQTQLEECRFACRVYDGLLQEIKDPGVQASSLKRLLLDQKVYDFKGYIYIGTATIGSDNPINDLHPRVVHLDSTRGLDVIFDMDDFLTNTVSELAGRGFKRLAYVRTLWSTNMKPKVPALEGPLASVAQQCGIPTPKLWDMWLPADIANFEEQAYQVFLEGLRSKRLGEKEDFPEVLIVTDDVIARPLVFALREFGFHMPTDVQICTLSSEGVEFFYGTPVYRYEFSTKELAHTLISLLQDRMIRQGEPKLPVSLKGKFIDPFTKS